MKKLISLLLWLGLGLITNINAINADHIKKLEDVSVVSKVYEIKNNGQLNPKGTASDEPKIIEKGKENALLGIVIKANVCDNKRCKDVYISNFDNVIIKGRKIETRLINEFDELNNAVVRWYKIEPDITRAYSNEIFVGGKKTWRYDRIEYIRIEWQHLTQELQLPDPRWKKWARWADVNPVNFNNAESNVGTMRYQVEIKFNDEIKASSIEAKINGDIDAHRISVKGNTGNKILDWAYSFFNLPYIWGSSAEQADNYIGFDCADFVVSVFRKAGYNIPYTHSRALPRYFKIIFSSLKKEENEDCFYYSKGYIKFSQDEENDGVKRGDIVLWEGHTALLAEDSSKDGKPNGYFDCHDIVLHTLFYPPRKEKIKDAYYGDIKILRLK
ncbi:MAG: NlpC/P60 family protein [Candidatus Pacearchaeota archaeon]